MSRTTLLRVFKTKASWDVELHNSSGSGPMLWDFLAHKYKSDIGDYIYLLEDKVFQRLTDRINKPDVPLRYRLGWHLMCLHSVILSKHLKASAPLLRELADEIKPFADAKSYANHWSEIANFVSEQAAKHDKRMIGVAVNATSVADDWDDYPRDQGKNGKIWDSNYLFQPKAARDE